jgi:osmotically-inducible protein OsmY
VRRMSDEQLQGAVNTAIFFDQTVDSVAIVAEVDGGVVTLRGTVGSDREKEQTEHDVLRVDGVTAVHNELVVTALDAATRDDADLRGAVLQALALEDGVPESVDAKVVDGWVTLSGTATHDQCDRAEAVVTRLEAVKGVTNDVQVVA